MIHHWDFFGPDAQRTATHFQKHVHEFALTLKITLNDEGFFSAQANHFCYWLVVNDAQQSDTVQQKLRPRRSLNAQEHAEILAQVNEQTKAKEE